MALVRCIRCLLYDDLFFVPTMTKQASFKLKGLMSNAHVYTYMSLLIAVREGNALHSSRVSCDGITAGEYKPSVACTLSQR